VWPGLTLCDTRGWAQDFAGDYHKDLGWPIRLQVIFFIIVPLLSLLYVWKKGGLDWRTTAMNRRVIPKT
jgi:hypothetical protein